MTTNTPNKPARPDKYTVWNQAVEAVEIYLARNPRELTEDQLQSLFQKVNDAFTHDLSNGGTITPSGSDEQWITGYFLRRL